MRIFTKKSFKFRSGDEAVTTAALSFSDVPDWVEKDPIFALALKDKAIEIVEGKADEKRIEADAFTPTDADTFTEAKATDAEADTATTSDTNTPEKAQEEAKAAESTSKKKK